MASAITQHPSMPPRLDLPHVVHVGVVAALIVVVVTATNSTWRTDAGPDTIWRPMPITTAADSSWVVVVVRSPHTSTSAALVTDSPRAASVFVMTVAAPRNFIDRHTVLSFAQPPANAVTDGKSPAWQTTSKPTKLMIPNVGTNPPATQTPDEGRRR
ncbi:hypothetical protein ZWY2020_033848 [Hordeum vulgare]|nr:hypothetical protein ZWY2020_033848 [Hordeum vulgare]